MPIVENGLHRAAEPGRSGRAEREHADGRLGAAKLYREENPKESPGVEIEVYVRTDTAKWQEVLKNSKSQTLSMKVS